MGNALAALQSFRVAQSAFQAGLRLEGCDERSVACHLNPLAVSDSALNGKAWLRS